MKIYRMMPFPVNTNIFLRKFYQVAATKKTGHNIISASRRTDIPAFYSTWFMNRIREGEAIYKNPFFPEKKYTVDLSPEKVAGIFFWSRYPHPMFPHLAELSDRGYTYCFLYTVTGYPRNIEPRQPDIETTLSVFKTLSQTIGKTRVIWRYDPVLLNRKGVSPAFHRKNFEFLLKELTPFTSKVIISIIDPYKHTRAGIGDEREGVPYQPEAYISLVKMLADMAENHGLPIESCAEPSLHIPGITPGRCVDAVLMETLSGKKTSKAKHVQRKGCLCQKSIDIGAYNTCIFGCRYCYANQDHEKAITYFSHHDPTIRSMI